MTHRAKFSFYRHGLSVKFSCDAPPGAQCRLHCPEDCESFDYEAHEHQLVDAGACMVLPWLDNACPEETYAGEEFDLGTVELAHKYDYDYLTWTIKKEPFDVGDWVACPGESQGFEFHVSSIGETCDCGLSDAYGHLHFSTDKRRMDGREWSENPNRFHDFDSKSRWHFTRVEE